MGLLHCRWILYQLSYQGSPRKLEWVAISSSRGSSHPGIETASFVSPALAGAFLTTSATWDVLFSSVQFSSVTQSCLTLCDPMD